MKTRAWARSAAELAAGRRLLQLAARPRPRLSVHPGGTRNRASAPGGLSNRVETTEADVMTVRHFTSNDARFFQYRGKDNYHPWTSRAPALITLRAGARNPAAILVMHAAAGAGMLRA